jgi:hypothetical protein
VISMSPMPSGRTASTGPGRPVPITSWLVTA